MDAPLHILIDGRMVSNTGIGRLLQNIVDHLGRLQSNHRLTILVDSESQSVRGFSVSTRRLHLKAPIYSLREQIALPWELSMIRPDVTHYPNFNVPLIDWTRSVVTLCDLIYYLFPRSCPSWFGHQYARFMIQTAARGAKRIITLSEYSKNDIVKHLGIPEQKVAVVYPAVDRGIFKPEQAVEAIRSVREKFGIDRPYIFYTGNHEPRKNVAALIRAYRRLPGRKEFQLVVGGPIDPRRQELYRDARELLEERDLILTGSISEAELPLFYAAAELFVFPSRYEGFGLPPLEALACGVPVICSSATSLPEVVGDAALMFDPDDEEQLVAVIRQVLESPTLARDLRKKGLVRAGAFSWHAAAEKVLQVYRDAAAGDDGQLSKSLR